MNPTFVFLAAAFWGAGEALVIGVEYC
jgi:hypothetical protein